jgi:hypothetical protein
MRERLAALGAALVLALALLPVASLAAPTKSVPLATYPVAAPQPTGDGKLPAFIDDDELVRARLDPTGAVRSLTSDIRLKVSGSGDFSMVLPGPVSSVANLGGDAAPSLVNGHVAFQGFLAGALRTLAAEATLDPAKVSLPVRMKVIYSREGIPVKPNAVVGQRGTFGQEIQVDNLTGTDVVFTTGLPASAAQLAQVLEALRGVDAVWTPETNLADTLPVPQNLDLTGDTVTLPESVLVPMRLSTAVRLPAGVTVVDSGGADVSRDARGTVLRWGFRLPFQAGEGGSNRIRITYRTASFRVPAVETTADVRPLPSDLFEPPGGGAWADFLRRVKPSPALSLLAQTGMASLHRIGDLAPPVGRPGPGPENVRYDLVLESGTAAGDRGAPPPPVKAEWWAVLLALLAGALVVANAYWAWSRH